MTPFGPGRAAPDPESGGAAELLRQALEGRAQRVATSPDALVAIRARIRAQSRRRRGLVAGLAGLGTAAVAAVTAVVLGLGSGVPAVRPTTTPVTASPPPTPTTPAPTSTAPTVPAVIEPVYLVDTVDGDDMLYREWHAVPGGTLPTIIAGTVTNMINGVVADPDYRTLWPAGAAVRGVSIDGSVVSVDLTLPATAPTNPAAALQQLVFTVTAVTAKEHQPALDRVRVLVDGAPAARVWGINTSTPLSRNNDAQAPIWLLEPQEGAVVGRTFTVQVNGSAFEAAAVLRVLDANGELVDERPVQVAAPPARGTGTLSLTLPAGTYTLMACYRSAKDGSIQAPDTHTITVR